VDSDTAISIQHAALTNASVRIPS